MANPTLPNGTIVQPDCPEECTTTTGPNFPAVKTPAELAAAQIGASSLVAANITSDPFQLALTAGNDNAVVDSFINEAINIGGANVYVYKLLGIYEQCKLVDATGLGKAISNGAGSNFPASNAFDAYQTEWHSIQVGTQVTAGAWIGYDFGCIKTLDQSRRMYGIETAVHKHITAFAIKQSNNSNNRATAVRLEYSQDSVNWYGAGIAPLPDNDCLNTILMKRSAPARYWRLRPTAFNGGTSDYWGVQALEMFHNYLATDISNVQDVILFENRDRNYSTTPLLVKGSYDLQEPTTDLSRFGIEMSSLTYSILVTFSSAVAILSRPIVIGDIINLPSETQYDTNLNPVLKWLEVTDVTWSAQGYTPGWQPTILKITAQPAMASQETQDIFGDLKEEPVSGGLGLLDKGNGNNPNFQDFSAFTSTIRTVAEDQVPEQGRETSGLIRDFTAVEKANALAQGANVGKIGLNKWAIYGEDAMPPNNAPYTCGGTLPSTVGAVDGAYFRLEYTGLSKDIPARLYRFSAAKGRWVWIETDKRALHNPTKPLLHEYLNTPVAAPLYATLKPPVPYCDPEKP